MAKPGQKPATKGKASSWIHEVMVVAAALVLRKEAMEECKVCEAVLCNNSMTRSCWMGASSMRMSLKSNVLTVATHFATSLVKVVEIAAERLMDNFTKICM